MSRLRAASVPHFLRLAALPRHRADPRRHGHDGDRTTVRTFPGVALADASGRARSLVPVR